MKYFIDESKIKKLVVTKINNQEYKVDSNCKEYYVDYKIENCTCIIGKHGAPCKHQYAVVKKFNLTSEQFFPIHDNLMKNKLYFIATGKHIDDKTWCDDLSIKNTNKVIEQEPIEEPTAYEENVTEQCTESNYAKQNTTSQPFDEPVVQVVDNLKQIFNVLENKLTIDSQLFQEPITKFITLFNNIKTDSGLISALHTFGKYNGVGNPQIKPRKNLQGSKVIGVQPTTISSRKVCLGGRKVQTAGRPTKESRVHEHGYNKRKAPLSIDNIPMNKKKKAPHSIEYCTNQNINLGKQH